MHFVKSNFIKNTRFRIRLNGNAIWFGQGAKFSYRVISSIAKTLKSHPCPKPSHPKICTNESTIHDFLKVQRLIPKIDEIPYVDGDCGRRQSAEPQMKCRWCIFENVKVILSAYFNRSICYTSVTFFKLFWHGIERPLNHHV